MSSPRIKILAGMGAAALGAVALIGAGANASHNADPSAHPVPAIDLGLDNKAVIVDLSMTGPGSATMTDAQIAYGPARGRAGDPPLLRVSVLDDGGALAQQFNAWDPRWVEAENSGGGQSMMVLDESEGTFIFPFEADLRTMTVFNEHENQFVGSFDLGPAFREFCEQNPTDPDCMTDLSTSKSDSADPAVAGTSLDYTVTITNNGPNPAHSARVVDTLPAGLSFESGSAGCSSTGASTVECELGAIPAGEFRTVTITASIDPALVYDNGAPLTVTNTAVAENPAGADFVPWNNTDAESTLVKAEADLGVASTTVVSPPTDVLIGEPVDITVRAIATSDGPSSPMDADLTRQAQASPGSTVSPTSVVESVIALEDGEERAVDTTFEIGCEAPGEHTFTFTDSIAPSRPDDVDPVSANNSATTSFTVDCVVPVALNNKPGSDPNSRGLTLRGSVPVAILTTDSGEYDLPLGFDASTVDPLSARWGAEDIVWSETGGASETHDRGHLEDSYELDDSTRDGDLDMVLHFDIADAGLTPTDDVACVKGTFAGPMGEEWTFFGCDAIRLRS